MIIEISDELRGPSDLRLCTHNGIFHSDDVLAIAILDIVYEDQCVQVVRTRDKKQILRSDIVVDVGGGDFDHHIAGFNVYRKTGEKFASAGLVWKNFGVAAIGNVLMKMNLDISATGLFTIKEQIDREFIIPVDMEDNGEKVGAHTFSFIPQFLPSFLEEKPDYNRAFEKAESIACEILYEIIKQKISNYMARIDIAKKVNEQYTMYRFHDKDYTSIIELPSQTTPWLESVVEFNQKKDYCVNFVIFPYPDGGWAAQCVPPSMEKRFEQLVPFPKEWAGGNMTTLPRITGIKDATFCHNGRFFARAMTKESIIEMCLIAMDKAYN